MEQPPGFVDSSFPQHVCLLQKALYGLKQAPRQWFSTFSSFLLEQGFTVSKADPSLFLFTCTSIHIYILIYVDDILLTGNNTDAIADLLLRLQLRFKVKDLGNLSQFLGVQFVFSSHGISLHQQHYAKLILQRAGLEHCKPVSSPLPTKYATSSTDASLFPDAALYRRLAGSLQYLTITRPDLTFAVNYLCQFMHKPLISHYQLLKRVLRYVKGSLDFSLLYRPSSFVLTAYCDSDWAGDPFDRRSTTGFCVFLGDNPISWSSKKQPTIARSSTEAEYRALAITSTEIIWLRRLLSEFHISPTTPTALLCDNVSALALAANPVFHARTKHIEIDYHFIREKVNSGEIKLSHISSIDQPADLFTKAHSSQRHHLLCSKLHVLATSQLDGGS
ncbi:uncharacterized mitochondrial protein AtMg00810-like [Phoenix dactylifera]|uniref:Uncharacterized mitochondrial protein AtMg00810-like n=1 Tax=Phoenix dactylifera TaxID=42345 RepID=A0A8B8ZPF8_PHODC|nr:uncharacterized mitochondrial protein AtMg00810-like [Phoenix dactylifera]